MMYNFSDLRKRLLVSAGTLSFCALLIYFSVFPIVELLIMAVIASISGIATWEYCNLCKAKGLSIYRRVIVTAAILEIIAIYLSMMFAWAVLAPIGVLIVATFIIFFLHFNKIEGSIASISSQIFGLMYVAVPLGLMLKILYPDLSSHFNIQDGRLWFAYLISVSKITDVGAYFGGRLIGKRKLAPILSPNKTWEGAIVGFVFAIALSLVFAGFGKLFGFQSLELSLLNSVLLGGGIALASQLGDLAESLLKRDANIKDSNSLPGLGGVLDTLDSLLFAIPVLYFYLHTV